MITIKKLRSKKAGTKMSIFGTSSFCPGYKRTKSRPIQTEFFVFHIHYFSHNETFIIYFKVMLKIQQYLKNGNQLFIGKNNVKRSLVSDI